MRPRRVSEVDTDIMQGYIPLAHIHDNPWFLPVDHRGTPERELHVLGRPSHLAGLRRPVGRVTVP